MRMNLGSAALAAMAIVGAACGSARPQERQELPPTPVAAADAAVTASASPRGGTCAPSDEDPSGGCAAGLLCMPGPGGYCTSFCGGTGGPCDGVCVETSRAGEVCAVGCASDADCRADEGYVCDPDWKACVPPGMASPRFAACEAPRAPRKTFGPATQLSTKAGPGLYHHEPSAAIAADGTLAGLYIAGAAMGAPNTLGTFRVSPDGAASGDTPFTSDRENHFDPWVAADAKGTLHAVWLAFDGGRYPEKRMAIEYARSTDGGATWSTPVAIHAAADCPEGTPGCMDKPMIAVGPDATRPKQKGAEAIYVVYDSEVTEGMRMIASRDGGQTFTPESVPVLDGGYGDLWVDARGRVYAVTTTAGPRAPYGSADAQIQLAISTDGKTFGAPVKVSGDEPVPFYFVNPNVATSGDGKRIYVAYASGGPDLQWRIVLATSADAGATWKRTAVDPKGCGTQAAPDLAVDPRGKGRPVHLIWAETTGGGERAYTACTADGATCAPPEPLSSAPFAAFSFARHSTRWMGEYGTLTVDPRRRVLHAVWTQTVDEGGVPVARIFHASAPLK